MNKIIIITSLILAVVVAAIGIRNYSSPVYGIGGDGWYIASSNGLTSKLIRIKMDFKTTEAGTLFNINYPWVGGIRTHNTYTATIDVDKKIIITRRTTASHSATPSSVNAMMINPAPAIDVLDNAWHTIEVKINIDTQRVEIVLDGVGYAVVDSTDAGKNPIGLSSVFIGGFPDGKSLQGRIKNIYFGPVSKVDFTYQYMRSPGPEHGVL